MKSVLLHIQDDDGLEARLQAALSIARASEGHVSCVHITPMNAYVAFDGFGGAFVMSDIVKALEDHEAKMRAHIEARLKNEDVSWDYTQITADPTQHLIARAALADVLVVSRNARGGGTGDALTMFGDVLHASHTPMLLHPNEMPSYDPLGPAVIAWNGSYESANALRMAAPLLRMAAEVHIVTIEEQREDQFPSTAASEYLSRHGVSTEIHSHAGAAGSVAEKLIEAARAHNASTLVMGAYGHSRAREYLFGGVTRSMLKDCPIPLLLAR